MEERKVIAIDTSKKDNDRGKCIIKKSDMKKLIGRSPDFIESMFYARLFWIKGGVITSMRPSCAASFTRNGMRRGAPASGRFFGTRYK